MLLTFMRCTGYSLQLQLGLLVVYFAFFCCINSAIRIDKSYHHQALPGYEIDKVWHSQLIASTLQVDE